MIIKKDRSKIRARHDFESLRNPARDRGLNFAWISLEFFRTVIKLFTYTEVNSFPPLHLAEGNFSAPFVGNFLGENLAAGVAEVSKKRKIVKDLFQSLSYFLVPAPCPSSGVSKIIKYVSSIVHLLPRLDSTLSRLFSFFPFFADHALHFHASTWKFNVQVLPAYVRSFHVVERYLLKRFITRKGGKISVR